MYLSKNFNRTTPPIITPFHSSKHSRMKARLLLSRYLLLVGLNSVAWANGTTETVPSNSSDPVLVQLIAINFLLQEMHKQIIDFHSDLIKTIDHSYDLINNELQLIENTLTRIEVQNEDYHSLLIPKSMNSKIHDAALSNVFVLESRFCLISDPTSCANQTGTAFSIKTEDSYHIVTAGHLSVLKPTVEFPNPDELAGTHYIRSLQSSRSSKCTFIYVNYDEQRDSALLSCPSFKLTSGFFASNEQRAQLADPVMLMGASYDVSSHSKYHYLPNVALFILSSTITTAAGEAQRLKSSCYAEGFCGNRARSAVVGLVEGGMSGGPVTDRFGTVIGIVVSGTKMNTPFVEIREILSQLSSLTTERCCSVGCALL